MFTRIGWAGFPGMVIISLALGKETESEISYLEIDMGKNGVKFAS
jgi:hypothetical protein